MSLRRDVTKYLGGAAVGSMVGFYVGIQDLLGIRSSEQTSTQPTPDSPESGADSNPDADGDSEPSTNQELLIGDDFESNHDMSVYEMQTNRSQNTDWGTDTGSIPDDGSHYGYLVENYSGDETETIATSNETIRWDQSYSFEVLVRFAELDASQPYNSVDISWRGGMEHADEEMGESTIRMNLVSTDSSAESNDLSFGGSGVIESNGVSIERKDSTWYTLKGYVDEEEGVAEAKMWETASSEPDEYQITASVETGISDELPYGMLVDGRATGSIRAEFAHLRWFTL